MNDMPLSPVLLTAIRAKCMDCSGGSRRVVEECRIKACALYPYRCTKAICGGRERQAEIDGQLNFQDILTKYEG